MADYNEKLTELQQRLNKMLEYQNYFYREMQLIQSEIEALKNFNQRGESVSPPPPTQQKIDDIGKENKPPLYIPPVKTDKERQTADQSLPKSNTQNSARNESADSQTAPPNFANDKQNAANQSFAFSYQTADVVKEKSNFEEFIGKNILSIIGILITVIGVGIGAKYAIDRNLISPAMRIFIGYVFAFALLGLAYKLKPNYHKFSAVLLSGAIAIMYFLAYFAYDFYSLIPQSVAFTVMVGLTLYAVIAALQYDYQILAIIGLVGAYAVPFLLSQGSGRADILFSYISIINLGVLAVSTKKYWKYLNFAAFGLSWLIFLVWYLDKYRYDTDFSSAFVFATVFFVIFYASLGAYHIYQRQEFSYTTTALILINSAVFFIVGYSILDGGLPTQHLIALFAAANAVIHLAVGYIVSKFISSRRTLYFLAGLSLFFITFAIPFQKTFDTYLISIFWTIEAVFLFWVGYGKSIKFYEIASYLVAGLATLAVFFYLAENSPRWSLDYLEGITAIKTYAPFFNKAFLINLIYVGGIGVIGWLAFKTNKKSTLGEDVFKLVKIGVSVVFIVAFYNLFRSQIENYWHLRYLASATLDYAPFYNKSVYFFNSNYSQFSFICQAIYTMIFLSALSLLNLRHWRNAIFGYINLALNSLILFGFVTFVLYTLSELRENYLSPDARFPAGIGNILIRYLSLLFAGLLIYATYRIYKSDFVRQIFDFSSIFDIFFALLFWIILSSEAINLMDIYSYQESYKLALSLLWGAYSMAVIALGIMWRKTHLRFFAIGLFGLTLLKLFLYDLSSLSTIAKTIVFVSLGVMLLIISFLYNKYKGFIFDDISSKQEDKLPEENSL